MAKKIAILQSNYIPWKGYFDIINMVDIFVIYDDVQYTKNDWRNRNIIKTKDGKMWLTIPCRQKNLNQKINETFVTDKQWHVKHWNSIKTNYAKSRYFKFNAPIVQNIYYTSPKDNLSEINYHFMKSIMEILNIQTKIVFSSDLGVQGDRNNRLINICKKLGANKYLSGPAARNYLQLDEFKKANIEVEWMDYSEYTEYHQLFPPFEHGVTILDLILNEGTNASIYMKSFEK